MSHSFSRSNAIVFFVVAGILSIAVSIVLGLALAIGFTLTCIFTSIDLGSATICGLMTLGITICSFFQLMMVIDRARKEFEVDLTDEEVDSDVLSEDQVDTIAEQLTEAILMRISVPQARTGRSSGRIR